MMATRAGFTTLAVERLREPSGKFIGAFLPAACPDWPYGPCRITRTRWI
jgi:hypothetical protein